MEKRTFTKEQAIKALVYVIKNEFRTFGGGKTSSWGNPITAALKDSKPQFAAGVDVEDVVKKCIDTFELFVENNELGEKIAAL